jgi:rhodanese-related sulfurtransferase
MAKRRASRGLATTGKLLAVVDRAVDAPRIVAALGQAGIDTSEVSLLRGEEGAARIDATGAETGLWARLRQATSFTLVDQMPDFVLYQAAILDRRTVLAVPIPTGVLKAAAVRILREHGAHFINLYGRFATEELDAWRGPELEIPSLLRR